MNLLHACHFLLYNAHPYRPGSIVADVQNFYGVSSDATTESVENLIKQAIADKIIANASFTREFLHHVLILQFHYFRQYEDPSNVKLTCFLYSQQSLCVILVSVMISPQLVMVMVQQCALAVAGTSSQNSQLSPAFVSFPNVTHIFSCILFTVLFRNSVISIILLSFYSLSLWGKSS